MCPRFRHYPVTSTLIVPPGQHKLVIAMPLNCNWNGEQLTDDACAMLPPMQSMVNCHLPDTHARTKYVGV